MKSEAAKNTFDDEIHPHFRKHAKTLATVDFKRQKLPPIRSRSSTYSCSRPTNSSAVERVRNFSLSSHGIENKGDSFRVISPITGSPGNTTKYHESNPKFLKKRPAFRKEQQFYPTSVTLEDDNDDFVRPVCNSIGSCSTKGGFRIKVIGYNSVGKSMMINQMTTSQFIGLQDIKDNTNLTSVSLSLDGEESTLELEEVANDKIHRHSVFDDAFIMIYSISDAASFIYIKREVCRLREKIDVDRPIIIVANKTDLNRTRAVTSSEGKAVAHHYNCKYVETSVAFQVRVDELLVALVRQIRLTLDPKTMIGRSSADWNRGPKHLPRRFIKARTLLQRLFGRKPRSKRNGETCEEIFRL